MRLPVRAIRGRSTRTGLKRCAKTASAALLTRNRANYGLTVSVKVCMVSVSTPFIAMIVYVPADPAAGMPLNMLVVSLKVNSV